MILALSAEQGFWGAVALCIFATALVLATVYGVAPRND